MSEEKPELKEVPEPEWLKKKRDGLITLQTSVEELQKDIQKRREARLREKAREQVCYWVDNVIFPFLQGIAESFDEPLLDGVKRLIREGKNPFRPTKHWNRTRETEVVLKSFLNQPQTKMLQVLAKPFLKAKLDWIHKEASWIREEILKEEYPQLYETIMEAKGGKEWLDQLITDLTKKLRPLAR